MNQSTADILPKAPEKISLYRIQDEYWIEKK